MRIADELQAEAGAGAADEKGGSRTLPPQSSFCCCSAACCLACRSRSRSVLCSIVTTLLFSSDSLASIAPKLFEAPSAHYTLLAIPFLILSSQLLSTGGVAKRLIRLAVSVVGYIKGGLAMASVLA